MTTAPIRYLNLPNQAERRVQTELHLSGCQPDQVRRSEAILGRDPDQVHRFVSLGVLTNDSDAAVAEKGYLHQYAPAELEMARFREHARLHLAGIGEAALTFGNARAVADVFARGAELALIIEDDSIFYAAHLHLIDTLESLLQRQTNETWEVIQLFGTEMPDTWAEEVKDPRYPLEIDTIFYKGSVSGTPSIVFNRSGMKKFLDAIAVVDPQFTNGPDELRKSSEIIEQITAANPERIDEVVMTLRFKCPNRVRCVADWIIKAMDLKRTFIPFATVRFMEGSTKVRDEDSHTENSEVSAKWLIHHRLAAKNINLALLHMECSHFFKVIDGARANRLNQDRVMIYWDVEKASTIFGEETDLLSSSAVQDVFLPAAHPGENTNTSSPIGALRGASTAVRTSSVKSLMGTGLGSRRHFG